LFWNWHSYPEKPYRQAFYAILLHKKSSSGKSEELFVASFSDDNFKA